MRVFKEFILPFVSRVCIACVSLTYIFFFFVQAVSKDMQSISFMQYLWLFVFSVAFAASFYLFRLPLAKPLLVLMHYAASASSFFIIFSLTGNLTFQTTARFFVAVALYTVLYALLGALYLLARLLLRRASKNEAPKQKKKEKETPAYEKRF